jgi:uncharacterized membrane protein (UPF0127 family)
MMKSKKMITVLLAAIVVVVLVVGYLWYLAFGRGANPQLPQATLMIGSNTWTVEIASTTMQQALGLSGREGLGANDGMLFTFGQPGTQNFWMKDMNFSLDMIWIAGNKVAGFAQDAVPQPGVALWSLKIYASPYDVDKVLEVNAGTVAKDNIQVGDTVTIGGI